MKMFQRTVWLKRLTREQEGQDLVEYALLVGFIAVVAAVGVAALGGSIGSMMNLIATAINGISTTLPS